MNQVIAIQQVKEKIKQALDNKIYKDENMTKAFFNEIDQDLQVFLDQGIDFKIVVDSLDDSIFITDQNGVCIYVNPAHRRNTNILPEEVIGRSVEEIVKEGKLFTGGAVMDVIRSGEKKFRLSTVNKTKPPTVGYAIGVPIFDQAGNLHQVVVNSRPILTLKALQEDFGKFLKEANSLEKTENIRTLSSSNDPSFNNSPLIGSSPSLQKVWKTIQMAAPTDATVLITGESGVGKEVVADEIYRLSQRNNNTFIKVNCASIPENLLESELFGYDKGAFSGANAQGKKGLFELANHGTLLLDEIGEMPMDLQVKLLRAIQNKEITHVGGTKPIKLDIRFIAATNSNLKEKISDGSFRQDLYYRLNVIPINIPPLRERLDDLGPLCDHFVEFYTQKHEREFELTQEQLEIMKQYTWPGNIRELENVIEYLTICASGTKEIADEMLRGLLDISQEDVHISKTSSFTKSVENYEKKLLESVLADSHSLREAGEKLGINASTISRKIKQYGINYHGSK